MPSASRILYVDDDKDSCELARVMLQFFDSTWIVDLAETADDALRLMEKELFDLYILDFNLPEISGIDLCRHIRRFDPDTPVMFFTAMARTDDRNKAMAAGANEYLLKPNDLDKFPQIANRLLEESFPVSNREFSIQR